mmetsp:Transcript_13099/g.28298  ORF Transcript_13099/g.28298 Transcript_13099/m.28298 type:complete len:85 (+) Transcript_13099:1311-1565(+)
MVIKPKAAAVHEFSRVSLLGPPFLKGYRQLDTLRTTDCAVNVVPWLARAIFAANIEALRVCIALMLCLKTSEKWMLSIIPPPFC